MTKRIIIADEPEICSLLKIAIEKEFPNIKVSHYNRNNGTDFKNVDLIFVDPWESYSLATHILNRPLMESAIHEEVRSKGYGGRIIALNSVPETEENLKILSKYDVILDRPFDMKDICEIVDQI